jgi:tellurium resistance protein TerD
MATFKLDKGNKFALDKGIKHVVIGLGWEVAPGVKADIDAHAFGCIINASQNPQFYNDASHALSYAAKPMLKVNATGSFETQDGSLHHSGDDRSGSNTNGGDDEVITAYLDKLPEAITEVQIWITIHEPKNGTFGCVRDAFIRVLNQDNGQELCRYDLKNEFASARSIQIGSLIKNNNLWSFHAIGAGLDNVGLEEILNKLS